MEWLAACILLYVSAVLIVCELQRNLALERSYASIAVDKLQAVLESRLEDLSPKRQMVEYFKLKRRMDAATAQKEAIAAGSEANIWTQLYAPYASKLQDLGMLLPVLQSWGEMAALLVPALVFLTTPIAVLPANAAGVGLTRLLALPFCTQGTLSVPMFVAGIVLLVQAPARWVARSAASSIATIVRARDASSRSRKLMETAATAQRGPNKHSQDGKQDGEEEALEDAGAVEAAALSASGKEST